MDKIKYYYDGNINCVNKFTKLNLLQTVMCGNERYNERLDIISFLIQEGIEVNSQEGKNKQNALHLLYASLTLTDEEFILSATEMLVGAGIDINQKDEFGAIPLSYLIAGKLESSKIEPILIFLIESGAKCNEKDNYGNSCVDYAKQFSWRKDILEIMKCTMNKEQLNVAQEAMIEWLADPHELGKRPSKIECVGEFEFNEMRYYMFKFKAGLFGKWLVGVCGGFEDDDLEPCGHTFSDMQAVVGWIVRNLNFENNTICYLWINDYLVKIQIIDVRMAIQSLWEYLNPNSKGFVLISEDENMMYEFGKDSRDESNILFDKYCLDILKNECSG